MLILVFSIFFICFFKKHVEKINDMCYNESGKNCNEFCLKEKEKLDVNEVRVLNNGNYSALYISKYLLFIAKQKNIKITNLKLQKLLYFIQGFFYLKTKEFLFDDDFEAWNYGPVVPNVYFEFKRNCSEPILMEEFIDVSTVDSEICILIDNILETFGRISVWGLVEMTHKIGPWSEFYNKSNNIIPKHKIATFFEELKRNEL